MHLVVVLSSFMELAGRLTDCQLAMNKVPQTSFLRPSNLFHRAPNTAPTLALSASATARQLCRYPPSA